MSDSYKRRTKPYLPRYQPLSSAAAVSYRRRCSNPFTTSYSRELIYYIDGSPKRVINSYHGPNSPSFNKASRIFLCSPGSGHCLTRVTGSASFNDVSASHVYTNPGNILNVSTRRGDDSNIECQNNLHSSQLCLDMTLSESGVSVGESEDWSVFGREMDSISQRSSNSWSTFCEVSCDNDFERRDFDSFSGAGFLGDEPRDFHYSTIDDNNFGYENQTDCMPIQDPLVPENTCYMHSHDGYVKETLKNVSPCWQSENRKDQLEDFPVCASNLESHPGMLHESVKYNIRQISEQTVAYKAQNLCCEDWQHESRDSVVSDNSYSSEWHSFPHLGDNFRSLPGQDISKLKANHEDFSCDNGYSEDFSSDVLDSTIPSVSGDAGVTRTHGDIEMTNTHDDSELTRTPGDMEIIRTCGNIEMIKTHYCLELPKTYVDTEFSKRHGDLDLARTSGDIEFTRTSGDIELKRTSSDMELTRVSSEMELTKTHGDMEFTRTSGDVKVIGTHGNIEATKSYGEMELSKMSGDVGLTRTSRDMELTRTHGDLELTKTHGDMELTNTRSDIELTKTHGGMELTRTRGDMELIRAHGVMEDTKTHGDVELTRTPGDTELMRIRSDMEVKRTQGDVGMTMCYSPPNTSMVSSGDNTCSSVDRGDGAQCGACSFEDCINSVHGAQTVRGANSVEARGGTHVYSEIDRVQKGSDVYSVTGRVQEGTNVYSVTDRVEEGRDVYSVTDIVQEGADVYSVSGRVEEGTGVYSVTDRVQEGRDVYSVIDRVQESTNVYSVTGKVEESTDVYSVQDGTDVYNEEVEAQEGIDVYSEEYEVREGAYVYSEEEELQEGIDVYSGEDVTKRHSLPNDNNTHGLKYGTADCYRATVEDEIKDVSKMSSKHQFMTSGETLHEADSPLESRHESSSSGTVSENQILYKIGNVQKNDATSEKKFNQYANVQTDRLSYCEDNEGNDTVKLHTSTLYQTVQSTHTSEMLREDSGDLFRDINYFIDDTEKENDLLRTREMLDDDDDVIASSVSARNLLPFVGHVVDKLVRYSGNEDTTKAKYTRSNRVKCREDSKATDCDNASRFLPPEIISKDDVNSWDLPGITGQRCINNPEGCVIDSGGESTHVKDEQTRVKQSSVCLRDSASVDSGIYNNNTRVEHVIDSSCADDKNLSCGSEFWEEAQPNKTVLGKTGSIKNKHSDIGINTDPGHAQPVKQRRAHVTQQFENQCVISFDSSDISVGFHLCVYCGKRIKTYVYSRVCSRCVCQLYNESLADYEKVINNCCRREDIDSCGGIPVSILDESITHAREKLRRDKGTQHVHHFCAETQGVGSGKTDAIISCSRPKEQEANKSSSEHDRYNPAVDHRDNNLLSISRSGTDTSSHNVLSEVSIILDTASRISESCQTGSWNTLCSDLTTKDSVSIDITSSRTISSTHSSCVPSDCITSTPDIKLRPDENLPSVAPTCLTSPASSIVSRDKSSDIQKMKENCGNLDMNSSTSGVNIDLDYLVSLADSSHRKTDNVSSTIGLFTSGCLVNRLDNLHAQLSFISGNNFRARTQVSGHVPIDIYRDRAEPTCAWKYSDAGGFSNAIRDHAIRQRILDTAAGKEHLSRSRNWNGSSPSASDSLDLPDTKEEYDNDDTYVTTATTLRGSRFLPRFYHHMQLFKYGQAKVSSLWTVPEEPENICDETPPYSSSILSVEASLARNSPSDQTVFISRKPFAAGNDTALRQYNSLNNTGSKKCTLNLESIISVEDNHGVLETEDNERTHLSTRSGRALSSLLEKDHCSLDLSSNRTCNRTIADHASVECRHDEIGTCGRYLIDGNKNTVDPCTAYDPLDKHRHSRGDASAGDQGMSYNFFNGIRHQDSAVCEQVPQESSTDNLSALDRLTESLSQFRRHDVDLVFATSSSFREDAADSDTESQQSLSTSITVQGRHGDRSDVSDLGYNDSFTSDLDSNISSDSIRHTHFTATGKAEVKEAGENDYDNVFSPRPVMIQSHLKIIQADLDEIVKNSEINVNPFETIQEETSSMSQIHEIAQMMPPQNECAATTSLPTSDCDDLYRAFTNEVSEKQQNHTCIVLEDEYVSKYRFKRFLKKSHTKRKKGLKVLNFFSRLSCVSGAASSPISSPVLSRKHCNEHDTFLNAEPKVLPQQTISDPLLDSSSSCHHHEIHSLSSVGPCSSPSSSNQSLDSVPSKTDSAYSSFSESLEAAVNSPESVSRSNNQIHAPFDHLTTTVNMDSSIGSYSSSLDCSLDVDVIHVSALNGADIRTAAPKYNAVSSTDTISDILDELKTCQGEIDSGLLDHMKYGHHPAKVDKRWG